MKKNILYIGLALMFGFTSCNDYLDQENESKFENEFVFQSEFEANKVVLGAYELFRANSGVHSNGLFYDMLSVSSDMELGPEMATNNARYNNENFYPFAININGGPSGSWDAIYKTINRCNVILDAFDANETFKADVAAGKPTGLTHLYGEVATLRAIMYYELSRVWGDVIYSVHAIQKEEDYKNLKLTDRRAIQEGEIASLQKIEPLMYYLKENSYNAERVTRGTAQAMIARLALVRGGYALRPAAMEKADFEYEYSDAEWGFYGRAKDWKDWYKVANTYLKLVRDKSGAIIVTDDKGTGNAYQQVFQQMMNLEVSKESLFEVAEMPGIQNERPYAFGRPSSGGSTANPPKAYGQIRFQPWFYWGAYDSLDLRRDVTVAVTGLSGSGTEILIPWLKGNVCQGGGIALNKWDYCRIKDLATNVTTQRKTGINAPYIRFDDMLLLLAETEAVLAKEGVAGYSVANAKAELRKIRARAFATTDHATKVDAYLAAIGTPDQAFKAIQDERMFELAGEGMRKFDLIRWGIIQEKVRAVQDENDALIEDLKTKGYHEYPNGQHFPAYVYTKEFAKADALALGVKNILIGQTPKNIDKNSDLFALQFPGWRGNTDLWTKSLNYKSMAIRGLFKYIPEGSAEDIALKAAGYARVPYGIRMVYNATNVDVSANWTSGPAGTLGGYSKADYLAKKPVRYLQPIPSATIAYSNYQITNSYGFGNE